MKIHFISIGGSVMHQLAIALKRKGYQISGSDDEIFEPAKSNLLKEGLLPDLMGWFPEKIDPSMDGVILGMHARADNPELLKAKELNLPIYSFPEYIYQESLQKKRIVVGGSHGKTTTTSMIMHVLRNCDIDFDYLVGARLDGFDQSVKITNAQVIVCEGDEYPASIIEKRPKFHFLYPHIAIITGIAWDHINVFPTYDNYVEQFTIFINKIEKGGHLIYNESDTELKSLVNSNIRGDLHYHPYSVPPHTIINGITTVSIDSFDTTLKVFGDHNLKNLNAAWLACNLLGVTPADFTKAISDFTGAAKRLELLDENKSSVFYRDFAHAPSKVKATIEAVKNQFPARKLIGILELHTYSSLNEAFLKEYKGALDKADIAAVFFSRHALELKRMPELSNEAIVEGFEKKDLRIFSETAQMQEWLGKLDYKDTVTIFMSSGNYDGFKMEEFVSQIINSSN